MLSLLVFAPLFSFVSIFFFGRLLGFKGSFWLSNGCMVVSFSVSLILFYIVFKNQELLLFEFFNWFSVGCLRINWAFVADPVTSVMLLVITSISTLVHLYSINYMEQDPHFPRFMSYLSLFTFFMLILVTSTNFLQLFLGWEGVGLASYLLINFWHTRTQANKSSIKAMVVNRVGDFGLILCIFIIFYVFKTLDFFVIFPLILSTKFDAFDFLGYTFFNSLDIIIFFLFVGAMGKSAQLGLHTWLPDAMEGPTPVSALIHAATMVTAGVFVLIRFSLMIEHTFFMSGFIIIFGALTAFFAATVGLVQNDLKRVVAYSTCSQLGYMIFAVGISSYSVSLFHLMNHAFFKALLFLAAGSVIHAVSDEQDMRKMGGLVKVLPFTYISMLVGSFSLMGFPFLTGFYSKDLILEIAAVNYSVSGRFCYWLVTVGAFFTAFYSIRLVFLTFFVSPNGSKKIYNKLHEAPIFIFIPLFILSFFSIFFGYFFKDFFFGLGSYFNFNSSFVNTTQFSNNISFEFLPFYIKLIPVVFSLSGATFSFILYNNYKYFYFKNIYNFHSKYFFNKNIYKFFTKKWYFDNIYNYFFVKTTLYFGYVITFKLLDKGFFEYFGPSGFAYLFKNFFVKIIYFQNGFIFQYASFMMVGVFFFLFFFIFVNYGIFFNIKLILIIFSIFLFSIFSFYKRKN